MKYKQDLVCWILIPTVRFIEEIMKKYIFIIILLFSGSTEANDLNELMEEAEAQAQWNVDCDNDKCFLQVAVRYNKGTTGALEQVGLAVSYNLKNNSVNYIGFFLPAGVDSENGLMIRFLDTVPDGNSFKLEPSPDGFISLPVNECNEDYCASRVHADILSEDGSNINLLEEFKSREHVWILFKRNGNEETALVPVYKFRDEFSKITIKKESYTGFQDKE